MPAQAPMKNPLDSSKKRSDIAAMFAGAAGRYDLLNQLMTAGRHRAWRHLAASRSGVREGGRVLDLCCGTGDFMLAFGERVGASGLVCGLDCCREMLEAGRAKLEKDASSDYRIFLGDALNLPFEDCSFDAASIGWGIRNVEDAVRCLKEMRRALVPGGCAVVVESGSPANPAANAGFRFFSRFALPAIGRLLSDEPDAYRYLPESIKQFPAGKSFLKLMDEAGLKDLSYSTVGMGSVYIYRGVA